VVITERVFGFKRLEIIQGNTKTISSAEFLQIDLIILGEIRICSED